MLTSIFRSNQPIVLTGLLVLVPMLFLPAFFKPVLVPGPHMPLQGLVAMAAAERPWLQGTLVLLVVMLVATQLSVLVNDAELLDRPMYLPALIFPILLAAFGPSAPLEPTLLGMPFVLSSLRRTWTMSNTGTVMSTVFDAGMLMGIASMFYLPYAFLLVVIWASVSVIRPFQWREYVVPLMGHLVVFYFAWAMVELAGSEWRPLLTIIPSHLDHPSIGTVSDSQRILLGMVLAGVLPVGILSYSRSYRRGIMRQKNLLSSFLAVTAAFGILLLFAWFLTGVLPPVLLALPLVIFTAHAFQGTKRAWVGESVVFSLLILALWAQWGW